MTKLFVVLAALCSAPVGMSGEVRMTSENGIVEIGMMNEPLDIEDLMRVSFIASGTEPEKIDEYIQEMENILSLVPSATGDAAADGETLLEWMHDGYLRRYVEAQTRLDVLLENGTYNCVSSAVFYLILARSMGLPVLGVLTTDHAFCRIPTADGGIDVETTTPYGFDPGTRREAVDSFTGRTGFTYVPPGNYSRRKDIGEKELISLIYQNRISALQKSGRWGDTVGLARDRWELAGTDSAETDFRTSITNYAAEMDRLRRQEDGLVFLNRAARSLGEAHGLESTAAALLGNAVTYHLRAGRIDEAITLLNDEELTTLVPRVFVEERRREAAVRELENKVKREPFEGAVEAVDEALRNGNIDNRRWEELTLYLWSTEARRLSQGGKWLDGWRFLGESPERTQRIVRWNELRETYRHNAVVSFHNDFISAMRRNQYDQARRILDDVAEIFPDNPTLEQDRRALESRTGG
ncbi:MAG: hypothetical protein P1P77_03000 [Spirochaetaceae bacterium]|nr:hypothetical protein [Spirochaetaceae bacterium]